MVAPEVPDWTRPTQLFAKDPTGEFIPVLVDANGQLYIVIQGELAGITGSVVVDQSDSIRQVQGIEGANLRTVAVDASGRLIMVPYGTTTVAGTATVTQADSIREIQGADGATLRTVVVDSAGRMIMVPMGQSGNYLLVDADGFLAALMKGNDAGTLRSVAVDASGNIVAVMKALYGATLTTVACDASGRIIMIPTDPADVWGNAISMGNAELAARLTGLGGFDRRGNALLFDTFENGLSKGTTTLSGTGAAVELSSASSRLGGFSLKLTAGSDASRFAQYHWFLPYPVLSKVGFELSFSFDGDTEYLQLKLVFYDGTTLHTATIRYDDDNNKVQYLDSGGTWQDLIASVGLVRTTKNYHTVKMVVDLENDKYHRVLLDKWAWTTGNLAIETSANAGTPAVEAQVRLYGASGTNAVAYVDGFIVTQNEPA